MDDHTRIQELVQQKKESAIERYFDSVAAEAISYRDFIRFLVGTDAIIIGAFLGVEPLSQLIGNKYIFASGIFILAIHATAGLIYSAQILSRSIAHTRKEHDALMKELNRLSVMSKEEMKEWSHKRSLLKNIEPTLFTQVKDSPYTWTVWFMIGVGMVVVSITPQLLTYLLQ